MKHNCRISIIGCLLFLLLLTGCNEKESNTPKVKPKLVQSGKVISKTAPIIIESFGNLSADNSVDIRAQVSGQILKTHFDGGQFVNKGDLLVKIDPSTYEAKLENDEAVLQENKADYELKKFYVDKNTSLAKKGVMSSQDFEKMKAELAKADAQVKVSEANIKLDKINLARCEIYSPVDGLVGLDSIGEGNVISDNDTLLQVNKVNPISVDFTVPESNLLRLKTALDEGNLKVSIFIKSLDKDGRGKVEKEYDGVLEHLNNQTNLAGSTISLSATIPNNDGYLLPGQYATVKLQLGIKNDTKMIPVDSVQVNSEGKYVYLINNDNKVEMLNIDTGRQFGDYIELISDEIADGDRVVTVGQQNLTNETLIKVADQSKSESKEMAV
jgi:membrane fusion protein, multidrug efflux system